MEENIKFTCEECGKEFEPDPDAMVEIDMGPQLVPGEQAEALEESGRAISAEMLQSASADDLHEMGLTPAERDALLSGKMVTIGGMCICIECQDRLAEEQA